MQVKVSAFPATYLNAVCSKHECIVEVVVREQKKFGTNAVHGVEIRSIQCRDGRTDCTDFWEMSLLFVGDVTISQ